MGESINDVFSYFDPASLVLFSSNSSSSSYYSALDHLERAESKIPEVICIDDSPQPEETSSVSGETCPSVYECDNGSSVKEISTNSRPSSRDSSSSRTGRVEDFDVERNETREGPWPEENTASQENSERERSKFSFEEPETLPTFRSRIISLQDFTIPCLESISSLKKRFGSGCQYQLTLNPRKNGYRPRKVSRRRLYKYKRDLQSDLEQWETLLNEKSPNEAYIAVENMVDNEHPPKDFTYITHNILHPDISHLFDINYLVGCTCKRVCTQECCECPRNSGGEFAYDRTGKVRVEPGTPIYECNSQCPCGLSCRNRVLQRGRTVKVAIFRTSNGCGWGVKTMEPIEKNQLVTEYVGEVITQEEAEERGKVYDSCGQTYLFDLDFNDGECLYTLDAKKYGNISHFINHSCNPNLSVYAVWVDTLDPNFPRIALFANHNIKVGEELTFDYQMSGADSGSPGISPRKPNHIKCNCGSDNCRTYLF